MNDRDPFQRQLANKGTRPLKVLLIAIISWAVLLASGALWNDGNVLRAAAIIAAFGSFVAVWTIALRLTSRPD